MIKRREPRTALEIGTARGGTLFLLCRLAAGNAKIISLDLPHGPFGGGYSPLRIPLYKRFARPGQSLHLLRADSHSAATLERVNKLLDGELLDYLFIDADHTYEGVKKDFEMYAPLVRPGGMVVFHDIAQNQLGCEVPRFWNERKFRHPWSTVIIDPVESYGIGILEI
ncbi:MAG: class I SAM-dependent methyltransferase [Candidatus Acidiferrales bacterium]